MTRRNAYRILAERKRFSEAEVTAILLATARTESATGRPRPEGPTTIPTDGTRLLQRHIEGEKVLIQSLHATDWNVRRYAAFILGESCHPEAALALAAAIQEEVDRAATARIKVGSWRESPLLAPLREMFIALAKLNCYEALTAAESLLATSDCSFASYAGIFAIESIVSDPPIGAPAFKKGMCVTVEKRTWQGWRRAHKNAVTAVCQYHCAG